MRGKQQTAQASLAGTNATIATSSQRKETPREARDSPTCQLQTWRLWSTMVPLVAENYQRTSMGYTVKHLPPQRISVLDKCHRRRPLYAWIDLTTRVCPTTVPTTVVNRCTESAVQHGTWQIGADWRPTQRSLASRIHLPITRPSKTRLLKPARARMKPHRSTMVAPVAQEALELRTPTA